MTEATPEQNLREAVGAAEAAIQAAGEVVAQLKAPDGEWAVEDLTPEELAGLAQVAGTEAGMGCCQDGDEAGLGDSHHGLEAADGLPEG
jgi:hypothetical protein